MATILKFPRRRPLQEHEYPSYWGYTEKTYYEMRIADGVSHEEAFAEWDAQAQLRALDVPLFRYTDESDAEWTARLQEAVAAFS